jgi:hypothetical protein
MDPYEILGITPAYDGDLRALRNRLVKRHFEAGEEPDEERMKAINLAYELLSDRAREPAGPLSIAPGTLAPAHAGRPYHAQPQAIGGARPYRWEAALPPGLTLDATGAIEGRPVKTGSFPFTLGVTDRDGRSAQRVFVLHVEPAPLWIAGDVMPNATIGVPYEAEIAVEGGVAPLYWSGEPPPGLQLGNGLLFGTPLGPSATVLVHVRVRDSARLRAERELTLVVRPRAAAGDATQWTPERLADEHHAQRVAAHETGIDAPATRARVATLERRLARRRVEPAAIAAAVLVVAAAALLSLVLAAVLAAALMYLLAPTLLAPTRQAQLERLQERLGCGDPDCPRC